MKRAAIRTHRPPFPLTLLVYSGRSNFFCFASGAAGVRRFFLRGKLQGTSRGSRGLMPFSFSSAW